MSPEQREQVRLCLLRYGLGKFTVGLARSYLVSEGFSEMTKADVKLEIQYLRDKGFLEPSDKAVSPEVAVHRTTAAGRDYLAEQGQE